MKVPWKIYLLEVCLHVRNHLLAGGSYCMIQNRCLWLVRHEAFADNVTVCWQPSVCICSYLLQGLYGTHLMRILDMHNSTDVMC